MALFVGRRESDAVHICGKTGRCPGMQSGSRSCISNVSFPALIVAKIGPRLGRLPAVFDGLQVAYGRRCLKNLCDAAANERAGTASLPSFAVSDFASVG